LTNLQVNRRRPWEHLRSWTTSMYPPCSFTAFRTMAKGGWVVATIPCDEQTAIVIISSTRRLVRVVAVGRAMTADHHSDLVVRPHTGNGLKLAVECR
ncbi:hypothetical protein X777_07522, partial [Ooceraea biroi]